MGSSRRNVLIGLGGLAAGGGALLGTGAFTTVEAERTVSLETAGDADAFLALEPSDGSNAEYADDSGDTIEITIGSTDDGESGLNQNAITTIRNIIQVTNNGTQEVASLTLEFTETPTDVDPDDTFRFLIDDDGNQDAVDHASGGADILTGENDISDTLGTGNSINFGLEIDLIDGGDGGDLPDEGDYTLTISAEAAES